MYALSYDIFPLRFWKMFVRLTKTQKPQFSGKNWPFIYHSNYKKKHEYSSICNFSMCVMGLILLSIFFSSLAWLSGCTLISGC